MKTWKIVGLVALGVPVVALLVPLAVTFWGGVIAGLRGPGPASAPGSAVAASPAAPVGPAAAPVPVLSPAQEAARRQAFVVGLADAHAAAPDSSTCEDPIAVGRAWQGLRQARPTDLEYRAAQDAASTLERCRTALAISARSAPAFFMSSRRRQFGQLWRDNTNAGSGLRIEFFGDRIDDVTFHGNLDKRAAEALINDGSTVTMAMNFGFRRISVSDGGSILAFREFPVQSDTALADGMIRNLGLDAPFRLP